MRFARAFLAAALLASVPAFAAMSLDWRVLGSHERVNGETQADLSAKWWQWAASFQYADSPVSDTTGERCAAGQQGDVWFLAGTYESKVTRRTCRIPEGKTLFFPLINYVVMPQNCKGCLTCDAARDWARQMVDEPMGLFAELDDKPISQLNEHRVASAACFDLAERAKSGPKIQPSASDGFWLALRPLPKGRHTLRFGGSLPSLRQELVYTLVVE
jgi:hypothetical protein